MYSAFEGKSVVSAFRAFIIILLLMAGLLVFMSLSMANTDSMKENLKTISIRSENTELHHNLSKNKAKEEISKMNIDEFWRSVNLQEPPIPQSIQANVKNVIVKSNRISIMDIHLFYRESTPPLGTQFSEQSVLLLHGAAFKSQTWLDLGTISIIAAMGHHVIALDLPGYGETKSTVSVDKAAFLKNVILTLQLKNVMIVSPSMSGGFSIPFLIKHSSDIIGFMPVAPVQTELLRNVASDINTPSLIVYGELDSGLGYSSRENLQNLPNSQVIELPKARHPAYLDQPQLFHTLIYNFMNHLKN